MQSAPYIEIPLRNRQGEIVAHALIGREDAALAEYRWCLHPTGYAVRRDAARGTVLLHREVLGLVAGDGLEGDHKNRTAKLDNRRANLRVVTAAGNRQNLGSRPGATSSHRGVSWHERTGKWLARARLNGRTHYLGVFVREEDAAAAASAFRAKHMPFSEDAAVAGTMTA